MAYCNSGSPVLCAVLAGTVFVLSMTEEVFYCDSLRVKLSKLIQIG